MPDFYVMLDVQLRISANNEEQANDRATQVCKWIRLDAPKRKWLLTEPAELEVSVNWTQEEA